MSFMPRKLSFSGASSLILLLCSIGGFVIYVFLNRKVFRGV